MSEQDDDCVLCGNSPRFGEEAEAGICAVCVVRFPREVIDRVERRFRSLRAASRAATQERDAAQGMLRDAMPFAFMRNADRSTDHERELRARIETHLGERR